jgi:hypothetical protein
MEVEIEESMADHRAGRRGSNASIVLRAVANDGVELGVPVHVIDARQADHSHELIRIGETDRTANLVTAMAKVVLIPFQIHVQADESAWRADTVCHHGIPPPRVYHWDVVAGDFTQLNHCRT